MMKEPEVKVAQTWTIQVLFQNSVVDSKFHSVPRVFLGAGTGKRTRCMGAEVRTPNCRSIQILIVPISLVRWRSEAMKSDQSHPQ
jgi:hypothetical protein